MAALNHWLEFFNVLAVTALLAAAVKWGDAPERCVTWVLASVVLVDIYYHQIVGEVALFDTVDSGHVIIDTYAAVALVTVALWANRFYILWVAALQIVSLMSHFARVVDMQVAGFAYGLIYSGPFYFKIAIALAGLMLHVRREKKIGPYRAWRNSSYR